MHVNDILVTPLRRISTPKGDVLHGLKSTDPGYAGFGEAYLSSVLDSVIKGWKRHRLMTLNLICVQGAIRFVAYGETNDHPALDLVLSPEPTGLYARLSIPPMYWVGFKGVSTTTNMLLNVASLPHDPAEADILPLENLHWPV